MLLGLLSQKDSAASYKLKISRPLHVTNQLNCQMIHGKSLTSSLYGSVNEICKGNKFIIEHRMFFLIMKEKRKQNDSSETFR